MYRVAPPQTKIMATPLVHLEELESAESTERTMSGYRPLSRRLHRCGRMIQNETTQLALYVGPQYGAYKG